MPNQKSVALAEMLQALSAELTAMSETTGRLESLLAAAWAATPDNPDFHSHAQACDLVTQKLSATSLFIADIARKAPATWAVDVTEAVRRCCLSDIADKLSCQSRKTTEQSAGDFLMF